jgi:hypothetical protein
MLRLTSSAILASLLTHQQSRMHLLIVARDTSGQTPVMVLLLASHRFLIAVTCLTRAAAPLLIHMHLVAAAVIQSLRLIVEPPVAFQAGFHSVPSLVPLHMHVMSRDFDRCAFLQDRAKALMCRPEFAVECFNSYLKGFTRFFCSPSLKKKLVRSSCIFLSITALFVLLAPCCSLLHMYGISCNSHCHLCSISTRSRFETQPSPACLTYRAPLSQPTGPLFYFSIRGCQRRRCSCRSGRYGANAQDPHVHAARK